MRRSVLHYAFTRSMQDIIRRIFQQKKPYALATQKGMPFQKPIEGERKI